MTPTVADAAGDFLAVVLDEQLLEAEFDAIIAASWPPADRLVTPGPVGRPRSGPPEPRGVAMPSPPERRRPTATWRRERSPPRRAIDICRRHLPDPVIGGDATT